MDSISKEELNEIAFNAVNRALKKANRDSKRIVAELTMPNINSWNGKWSGEEDKYTILVQDKLAINYIGNYYYDFGDGWAANVEIRKAYPKEKITNNFCGYEWMIESILKNKKIISN